MTRVVVKLRATRDVNDLDPAAARACTRRLAHWRTRVHDPRISDAPFLTVEAHARRLDAAAVEELKAALAAVPAARPVLVLAPGREVPLGDADLAAFQLAAEAEGVG